ncbi:hypothetical protein LT679_02495 [Mucilaginibacter roseus]|uniref:Fimbrillin-A associated anchor s Mfa1 and Mfa2 family protein n=1 Tax=Mucilaginibacter roseus TaxID=1528868 RepID=A0ABS8TX56_9SPHI|nr:hypothetical protein [Mucilaginibacter roseus]MCD8739459.1 hypothetical protein [Mucilaginibacter roseus]
MKKIFFSLTLACIIISACKKDNKPSPQSTNGKKYQVAFNVSSFTQQYQNIKTNALGDSLIYPTYGRYPLSRSVSVYVCNDAGYQVAVKYVNTSTGNISLELNEGHYTAYFFSSLNDNTEGFNPYNDPRQTYDAVGAYTSADGPDVGTLHYGNYDGIQPFTRESFFKKVDFTVSTTSTTPITVQLTSIVAKVIVEVKDAIPDNIDLISIGVDSLSDEFIFKGTAWREKTRLSCEYDIPNTLYSQKGRKFVSYFLVEPNTIRDVKIGYRLKETNDSKVKTIQNVPLSPNSITVLSGKLFNNLGLKVDTTWNTNVINQSF